MKTQTIFKQTPDTNLLTKTECFICKKSVFKISRITPDLIMLKCNNCGETHMIATQSTNKLTNDHLLFWDADQENFIEIFY